MITILTHSPHVFSKEYVKAKIKKIFNNKRGPAAVAESLKRGLTELGIPHQFNPSLSNISDTVHVLSGIGALRTAIELKKQGKIKKLIAGPNTVVFPEEHDYIMLDNAIDAVLEPSQWTYDCYVAGDERYKEKIKIWPAGVADSNQQSSRNYNHCVIYQKNAPENVLNEVAKVLKEKNITYTLLAYGSFEQKEYYTALLKSDFAIHLSASESQGIALQEAWIRDVPTLVWNPGIWVSGNHSWKDPKISAPYLTDEAGRFFSNEHSAQLIHTFIADVKKFTPRVYCQRTLTDKVCAQKYIDILSNTK